MVTKQTMETTDGYQIYRPCNIESSRFRMTPQSGRFVIDNIPKRKMEGVIKNMSNMSKSSNTTHGWVG